MLVCWCKFQYTVGEEDLLLYMYKARYCCTIWTVLEDHSSPDLYVKNAICVIPESLMTNLQKYIGQNNSGDLSIRKKKIYI